VIYSYSTILSRVQISHHPTTNKSGPVKDALRGRYFDTAKIWKNVFMMCSEVEAGNFTTSVYRVLLNVAKCVESDRGFVEK
jgi:hypothetical protein